MLAVIAAFVLKALYTVTLIIVGGIIGLVVLLYLGEQVCRIYDAVQRK